MRTFLIVAVSALSLAACGGSNESNSDLNAEAVDQNLMANDVVLNDENGMGNTAGGLDGNASTNAATENAMATDKATNDPDTNLANGM